MSGSDDLEDPCFKCCMEYGTSEPCPDCSCDFLDVFDEDEFWEELEEQEYEAWDGGGYWEDEDEELWDPEYEEEV